MDVRIEAVRNDPCVGRGTCTSTDECLSDDDLTWMLNADGIISTQASVEWARDWEQVWMERSLNARWGEDSDPELKAYTTWEKNLEDNPLQKYYGPSRKLS